MFRALVVHLRDAPENDVVDVVWREVVALYDRIQHLRRKLLRMEGCVRARLARAERAAPAARCAHGVDDDGIAPMYGAPHEKSPR